LTAAVAGEAAWFGGAKRVRQNENKISGRASEK
jgi:hypothetical protein